MSSTAVIVLGIVFVLLVAGVGVLGMRWNIPRKTPRGQFALAAASSLVVGLLLGAAAIFGVTLMVQQDKKPPLSVGDGAAILNRVEYGDRS